jgi:hypothetical protein
MLTTPASRLASSQARNDSSGGFDDVGHCQSFPPSTHTRREARSWRADRKDPTYALMRQLGAAVAELRRAFDALLADAELDGVVAVGRIPLGEYWPDTAAWTNITSPLGHLRVVTMHRPSVVRQCRRLAASGSLTPQYGNTVVRRRNAPSTPAPAFHPNQARPSRWVR